MALFSDWLAYVSGNILMSTCRLSIKELIQKKCLADNLYKGYPKVMSLLWKIKKNVTVGVKLEN